ncbi:MAG: hypothetical protein O7A98_04045 [Acidobacteria bacterium]|nr:hypothetical protein [Acidobacteriota bacterium]
MSSHRHGSALLIAAALLTSACCLPRLRGPATRVLQQAPLEVTLPAQEMAVLAFVSYAGELLEGSDEAEKKFVNRIKPITSDCQDFMPAPRYDQCPDWGGDGH